MSTIHYQQVQAALTLVGSELDASELHGIVCGSICNQLQSGRDQDLARLLSAESGLREDSFKSLAEITQRLFQNNSECLYDAEKEFFLLLPDDELNVEERTRALADWCRGFILGLVNVGTLNINELPTDSAEVAQDMISISDASTDTDDPRGDEWALAEIEEYVRMGVQLIFEELQERIYKDRASGELH